MKLRCPKCGSYMDRLWSLHSSSSKADWMCGDCYVGNMVYDGQVCVWANDSFLPEKVKALQTEC